MTANWLERSVLRRTATPESLVSSLSICLARFSVRSADVWKTITFETSGYLQYGGTICKSRRSKLKVAGLVGSHGVQVDGFSGSTGYAQTSVACRARRASRRTESKIRKVMNWNFCSEFRVETVIEQSTLGQESRLLLTSE
jgi:hypothetical protein